METLENIAKLLKNEKNVAVISHVRPDGDAIGSLLALTFALQKMGIKVSAFCDDVIPKRFDFLNAKDFIKNKLTEGFSAYVAVDCADGARMGEENFSVFCKQKNTFNIDHHISNTRFAKYNYVFDSASNSENIYSLINCLGVEFDKKISDLLLMGVMTDTGGFRHKNVTPSTFSVASDLIKSEADVNTIYFNMFTKQSKERAKLFALTMKGIRYFLDDALAIGTVTQDMLKESGALLEDTEGFIDFIMGIDTVKVGICISEMGKNKYKCSFRSKGTDVNQVAGEFGGGGHVLASGCQIQGEYEEVVDKLRFAVSKYLVD